MKYFHLLNPRKTERSAIISRSRWVARATSFALPTGVLITFAALLIGQTGRDAYRQAYDVWQQAQTNLERDAGNGGAPQVAQADRSAAAVVTFEATRLAYLKSSAENAAQRRRILQAPVTRPSPDLMPPAVANLAAAELQTVTRAIGKFAADKDRGIQQLRQSMERESVALAALTDTIQAHQKAIAATSAASATLEQARGKTAAAFADQTSQFSQTVARMDAEGSAWTAYYSKLAEAIQVASAPPPAPAVDISRNVPTAGPRNASVSPVPLVRYVGTWTYPTVNGIYHGPQPESVALEVQEENGRANGTIEAKFKRPPGSADNPVVRFSFAGDIAATATQKFTLMTSDGASGVIELIPGPAFNLLEVNFQTDSQPNKIRSGNFILVKK